MFIDDSCPDSWPNCQSLLHPLGIPVLWFWQSACSSTSELLVFVHVYTYMLYVYIPSISNGDVGDGVFILIFILIFTMINHDLPTLQVASQPGDLCRIPFWDPSAHPRLLFVSSLPSCGCFTCVRNHTELHTSEVLQTRETSWNISPLKPHETSSLTLQKSSKFRKSRIPHSLAVLWTCFWLPIKNIRHSICRSRCSGEILVMLVIQRHRVRPTAAGLRRRRRRRRRRRCFPGGSLRPAETALERSGKLVSALVGRSMVFFYP